MQLIRSPTAYDDVISNNPTTVKLRKRETPVREDAQIAYS